jgi:hypothetical protein
MFVPVASVNPVAVDLLIQRLLSGVDGGIGWIKYIFAATNIN